MRSPRPSRSKKPVPVHVGRSPPRTVRVARSSDLPFVVHLQKVWSDNVGFLTRAALREYIDSKQLLLVYENNAPAGYLSWTCTAKGLVRLQQVAIDAELLRTTLGTKIMRHISRAGIRGNCSIVRLRSRSDLPANLFWPELGFILTATFLNRTKRMLPLLEWTFPLYDPSSLAQGIITHGSSFRPILNNRPPPDLRSALLTPP